MPFQKRLSHLTVKVRELAEAAPKQTPKNKKSTEERKS